MSSDNSHRNRTLFLAGLLHAFTHIYHVALMPLYLLIQKDFKLESVSQSTLLVTVMGLAYFMPSFLVGIMADRYSRKKMLGYGLIINGLGFISLGIAPNYPLALLSVVIAGLGGSFFHPAATALIARLYPVGTGKALGYLGIGASVGFFFSPIYSGWRAEAAGWRTPVIELGVLGVVVALVFLWLAEERPAEAHQIKTDAPPIKLFATPRLWVFFVLAALCFSMRDFAGSSIGSLCSLFLQKAHDFSLKETGVALSVIFLAAIISNPLFGGLSDRGRFRWTFLVLTLAALIVAAIPQVSQQWIIPLLACYGFFFMASYPMVEAALMESVHDSVRGRVFGLFITIGGFFGNISHWTVGKWVRDLGPNHNSPEDFQKIYLTLTGLIFLSLLGLPCLRALRRRDSAATASGAASNTKPVLSTPDAP